MNPSEFHQSVIDVVDSTSKFLKLWWAMLRNPEKNLNCPNARRLLPGVSLFVNLLLSARATSPISANPIP